MFKFFTTIWVNTIRKLLDRFINGFYNLYICDNILKRASLRALYSQVQNAKTPIELAVCFNACFKGYQQNTFIKDLDSLWSPSFSSVFLMQEAVCTGAAGVNLYLASKYAEVLNIEPAYIFMFGIWNPKLNAEGHAMTVIIKEDSTCVLLDYANAIPLSGLIGVKQYYQANYEKGAGFLQDYILIPFPAVHTFIVRS
jgi:hypothetical protein